MKLIAYRCQLCIDKGERRFEMRTQVHIHSFTLYVKLFISFNTTFMEFLLHDVSVLFLSIEYTDTVRTLNSSGPNFY